MSGIALDATPVDGTSHRTKVFELFEKHRATPGAPCDEQHFLDFLLPSPKKERAVYNSFRGLRRFNAFVDEVQLVFGICFSLKDRDANYSLIRFVDRVVELETSPRGSLISLKNQVRAGPGWPEKVRDMLDKAQKGYAAQFDRRSVESKPAFCEGFPKWLAEASKGL